MPSTAIKPPPNWPSFLVYLSTPFYSKELLPSDLESLFSTSPPADALAVSPQLTPSPHIRINPISDPSHPANNQQGLFATRLLPPSTFITFYLGHVHPSPPPPPPPQPNTTPQDGAEDHDQDSSAADQAAADDDSYTLSLLRFPRPISITALSAGNEARFVNDYRGIPRPPNTPAGPNAEFRDVWIRIPAAKSALRARRGSGASSGEAVWERRVGVFVLAAGRAGKKERARGIRRGEEILVSYGKGFWGLR